MREIVLDTETTGLKPSQGHKLVEIGAIELVNQTATGEVYHQYINPEMAMPYEAFKVHGISDEFLADKPKFIDIADEFLQFVGSAKLVIHNAKFDMGFINHELKAINKEPLPFDDDSVIDTLLMARKKFPGMRANLDALCQRYNINNKHRKKHGALLDAELLMEVYIELTGGRRKKLFVDDMETSDVSITAITNKPKITVKKYSLDDAIREKHRQYLLSTYPHHQGCIN